MYLGDSAHDRLPWPFFHSCSRLTRETIFAQVLSQALSGACERTWAKMVSRVRREQEWKNGHGSRSCAESPRYISQSRSKKQNTSDHFSGERGQAAGRGDLV